MLGLGTGKLYLGLLLLRQNDLAGDGLIMLTREPGLDSGEIE